MSIRLKYMNSTTNWSSGRYGLETQRLNIIKQSNLLEEKELRDKLSLEYRNYTWDLCMKYFGKIVCDTEMSIMFDQVIEEEENHNRKKLIDLKEKLKEDASTFHYDNNEVSGEFSNISPKEIAKIIFDQTISDIINKEYELARNQIKKMIENIEILKNNVSTKPINTNPLVSIQPAPKRIKKKKDHVIKQHVHKRNQLKRAIDQADHFIDAVRQQKWYPSLIPDYSP